MNIKIGNRWIIIWASLFILLLTCVGTVLAYISAEAPPVENYFEAGRVECTVNEVFDGQTKTDVSVKNTGNTPAYIRAAIIVSWQSDSDEYEILARAPVAGTDYEIAYGDSLWIEGSDGYWYYSSPVEPDGSTRTLIEKIIPLSEAPDGYSLSVEILASAIQATPINIVTDEWGVVNYGEMIIP